MRKLAAFAAPFSAAVFVAVCLLPEGLLLPLGGAALLTALPGLLLRGSRRLRWLLITLGMAAGLLWTGCYAHVVRGPARALAGQTAEVRAVVADWPQETGYGCYVLVRPHAEGGIDPSTRLYLQGDPPELSPGDVIRFTGQFRLADTVAGEPGNYYYAKGITLTASGEGEVTVLDRPGLSLRYCPAYAARALKERIGAVFPPSAAPLLAALITGDRSGLDAGTYSALRRAGLAHVVAVSGMHVSILAGCMVRLLGRSRRRSAIGVIALLFFFAAVTGNSPSVLRAAVMYTLFLLAPLLGREADKPTTLCTALMLLLLGNPWSAASVSLQLSFASVAGISLFSGRLDRRWRRYIPERPRTFWGRLGRKLLLFISASLSVTLGALAFTTPLTALYFNNISLIAPLANLLALWALSILFLGGLIAALLGLILPALAGALAWVISLPAWWVLWVNRGLSRLPFAAVPAGSVYLALWLALAYALLLLWLAAGRRRGRPWIPAGACALCLCAALLLNTLDLTRGRLSTAVLDVGQGLSVAFYSGGQGALVDCGGAGSGDPGDTAADYLQSLGLSRLEVLVLTHYHADHAAGVPQLLERLEVGLLIAPDVEPEDPLRQEILALAARKGVEVRLVSEDTVLPFGEAALRVYGPLGAGGGNEEGLSVLCSSGDFDVLITGDMNQVVEGRLVKYGDLPDIEVLVAGHHGSKYASSEELLLAATPEYAVISVGRNTYGHPAPEALERLAAAGCEIYRTDWMGTVRITAG